MYQTREIDGNTYRVSMLTVRKGRPVFMRLTRVLAAALETAQTHLAEPEGVLIGSVVRAFCTEANDADMALVEEAFASVTEIRQVAQFNNGPQESWVPLAQTFDTHFAGRYIAYFQWLAFCTQTNFADFLGGLGLGRSMLAQIVQTLTQSESVTQKSTNTPGASSVPSDSTSP